MPTAIWRLLSRSGAEEKENWRRRRTLFDNPHLAARHQHLLPLYETQVRVGAHVAAVRLTNSDVDPKKF